MEWLEEVVFETDLSKAPKEVLLLLACTLCRRAESEWETRQGHFSSDGVPMTGSLTFVEAGLGEVLAWARLPYFSALGVKHES